jgi:hypothetical protein
MALGGASSAGKSGDVRAGGAFVELSAKDQLTKVLIGLRAKALAFGQGLKSVGGGLAAFGAAASAPFALLAKGGVDRAEEISNLSYELGYTVDQMQRLKYAADVAGVSIEEITKNPGRFKDLLSEAPLMDPSAIKESVEANRAWRKTLIELQTAMVPLATAITPVLKGVAEFTKNNGPLIRTVALVAGGIAVLGVGLFVAGSVITATVGGIGALITVVTTVAGAVGAAAAAVGGFIPLLAIAGIAILATVALVVQLKNAFDIFRNVFPQTWAAVKGFFGDLFDIASETVGGVVSAIMNGDIEGAWDIALKGALVAWLRFKLGVTQVWVEIKSAIIDTFWDAISEVMKMTLDLGAWMARNDPTGLIGGGKTDAEINSVRDQGKAGADAARAGIQKEADDARRQQIAEAEAAVAKARAELKGLVAKQQKAGGGGAAIDFGPRISEVRGAFQRLDRGGQQFGGGNIASEQLAVLKDIYGVNVQTKDGIKELAKGPKLK